MKPILSMVCAAAMTLATFSATAVPVQAQSGPVQFGAAGAELVLVQQGGRRGDDNNRRGFERRGNDGYFNGHRGSRDRRPGYRQYNGFWFPPAAFLFGAIIGGALNQQNMNNGGYRLSQQHVNWCENRYRSYRASDNSFQPYNGPRQQCTSPYMG